MKRIASILIASCIAHAASAGVYVEMVSHDIKANTTELNQKIYVQNGAGRFVDPEGRASIIKGDTMYVVDENDKSYIVLDKATIEQLGKQLSAAMEKVKDQLAKMPPDQRAQMEQMMGIPSQDADSGKWEVETVDTGKSDKVEGRACKVWDVKRNGELDDQICVVPYSALPGKEDFRAAFANFAKVFEDMAKNLPQLSGRMNSEMSALSKVNGFPVRTRGYENGKLGNEEQLVKVWREEAVPASMFEIPAGYKQKKMPTVPGQ
jgi:hypothetical protein